MKRLFLTAAILALTVAAPARANAPLPPHFKIHVAACPGEEALGCTDLQTDDVYLLPGYDRFMLWHELGHVFDAEVMTAGDRNWFMRMDGLKPQAWLGAVKAGQFAQAATPGEKFADAFASCALNLNPDHGAWEGSYDYQPSARRHRQICAGIWRVDGRYAAAQAGTSTP